MEKLDKPTWVKMKEPELKKVIAELAEKNSPSQVGAILRDQYGIPTTKVFGKKLNAYLKELGIDRKETLESAEAKVGRISEHMKKNITDRKAKHKLQKAQSRLNITRRYYGISARQ
jgi:small subunit ribosomal protein S15